MNEAVFFVVVFVVIAAAVVVVVVTRWVVVCGVWGKSGSGWKMMTSVVAFRRPSLCCFVLSPSLSSPWTTSVVSATSLISTSCGDMSLSKTKRLAQERPPQVRKGCAEPTGRFFSNLFVASHLESHELKYQK